MPPFFVVFLGFSLAVTAVWLRHHFFTLPVDWLAISLPLLVCAGLTVFVASGWHSHRGPSSDLRIRRLIWLVIIGLLALVIFNAQAFLVGFLPGHDPIIPFAVWPAANLSFLTKLGLILATYFLLTVTLAATGNSLLKRFRSPVPEPFGYALCLRIAVGMSLWATLLVVLGALSALTPAALWLSASAIVVSEWRYVLSIVRWCCAFDTWSIDVRKPIVYIALFGLFLVALNLVGTIRPQPTGFDDMTYYMDRVQRMQASQIFISGGHPFPFELLAAAVGIASRDQTLMLALSLGVYGLLFGTIVLYAFGRSIFNPSAGIMAAVIALSIPMGPALALFETKPDAWLFPITTLFFWSLIRWLQSRHWSLFLLTVFLFGFALTIKLTAFFLIGPLGFAIGTFVFTQQRLPLSWRAALRQSLITVAFFLLPLLPWLILAEATHPPTRPYQVNELLLSFTPPQPSLAQDIEHLLTDTHCQATGVAEDLARFRNHRGALAAVSFLPWDITMNLTVAAFATEIGFLFLAALPLWLWFVRPALRHFSRHHLRSPTVQLIIFLFAYGVLWAGFAERVTWYGYPAIALAALLTASLIDRSRSFSPHLSRYLMVLLVLSVIGNTLVRLNFTGTREHLRYAGGTLSAEDYLDAAFPGLKTLRSAVNRPSLPRVYVTGSRLRYTIIGHPERTMNDPHLDTFNCLLATYGADGVLEKFRQLDIRYVLFSRTLLQKLHDNQFPTFREKAERFTDFAGHSLRVVWGSADYMLFEVPPAPFVPADNH